MFTLRASLDGRTILLPESRNIPTLTRECIPSGLLVGVAVEGLRPLVPADCNPDIAEILGLCWLGPDRRPSAAEFANGLERVHEENSDKKDERLKQTERLDVALRECLGAGAISNAAYKRINTIKSKVALEKGFKIISSGG